MTKLILFGQERVSILQITIIRELQFVIHLDWLFFHKITAWAPRHLFAIFRNMNSKYYNAIISLLYNSLDALVALRTRSPVENNLNNYPIPKICPISVGADMNGDDIFG